ncbi:MAG TPA: MBOAT family O-acyltransferase [Chthoniobacterales bacterium]|nr:MBOAT family O-acyltransferase [Chthoniobacterales bacterium]
MLFHSFAFFLFFAVTFTVYWLLRVHEFRMAWLVAASIVFYAAWNPWFVVLIAFTAGVDYVFALRIEQAATQRRRRWLLIASLGISLSLLVFFKYSGFLLNSSAGLFRLLGVELPPLALRIVLPLGISFYTFETISYVVDVYRRQIPAERNPLHYALYIMFFPHLIAGPIVRAGQFLPQIRARKHLDWARLQLGIQIFLRGLFKKAVLADRLAGIIDPIFVRPAEYSSATLWVAAFGYAIQVYCDFSGYTDMALGAAHALGFKLPQNFRQPYFSASVSEFWRRWHITLSTWVRDYIYIPMGGSRGKPWETYRNLIVTMAVLGLWHGAGWTFVIFGVYHGVLLSLERIFPYPAWSNRGIPRVGRVIWTLLLLCIGLVIFRSESLGIAWMMLGRMFQPVAGISLSSAALGGALLIIACIFAGHLLGANKISRRIEKLMPAPLLGVALALQFLLIQLLIPEDAKPFIYFQF